MEERKLQDCSEAESYPFMCNMWAREPCLLALLKTEYSQVKSLETSHKIWKDLESTFKGHKHAKRIRFENYICLFQEAKLAKDEFLRSYIHRIFEIFARIKLYEGYKEEDEIVWNILKILTPSFKQVAHMTKCLIPYTKKFTRKTFLGRLQVIESSLRYTRELTRKEKYFSALSVYPYLSRSESTHGNYANSNRLRSEEDMKIEERIAFLSRRELDGKKNFKC